MSFVTLVAVLVAVVYGADAACSDASNYASSCANYISWCDNAYAKWDDGKAIWENCKKTCNKCDSDNSSDGGSDDSSDNSSDNSSEDSSCVDEYSSWCGTNTGMCENGSWGDGTAFWKYCKKMCGCCDGSCSAKEEAKDAACGGETSSGPSASYFKSDILTYHNALRNKHQNTPSMSWDNTLQGYAQAHCNALVSQNRGLWHSDSSDRGGSGENLSYKQTASRKVCNKVGGEATQAWYDEIEFYDYSTGGKKAGKGSEQIGHFTQLVWSTSTKLGCAYSVSSDGKAFVCCNYNPPGNYGGQYLSKVKALKSLKAMALQKRGLSRRSAPMVIISVPGDKEVLQLEKRN